MLIITVGEALYKGAEGERDTESRLYALKLSGKRTTAKVSSGETFI